MAQCEMCEAWQHGRCMGFGEEGDLPEHYYCEQCRPDLYVELLRCVHIHMTCAGHSVAARLQETCQTSPPGVKPLIAHRRWARLSHVALTIPSGTRQADETTQHDEQP